MLTDGTVAAWGDDGALQLGNGFPTADQASPILVPGIGDPGDPRAVAVAGGEQHSLALLDNGTILAWGDNAFGQLGTGGAFQSLPTLVPGITTAVAIAAAGTHSMALLRDGRVMAWGRDNHGQLGDGTIGLPNIAGSPQFVTGLTGVAAIAAGGDSHSLAIQALANSDLRIDKLVSNSNPQVGETVDYTLRVRNLGPEVVPDVTVTDFLPNRMSFQSIVSSPPGATCSTPPVDGFGTIICERNANVLPGGSFDIVIRGLAVAAGPATEVAFVEGLLTNDPNFVNNRAEARVNVFEPEADLSITKVASDYDLVSGSPGDPVTFTLTVSNPSALNLANVTVVDTLPASLAFTGLVDNSFTCSTLPLGGSGTITCTGALPPVSSETITISATAKTPGVANNTATVSYTPAPGQNPDPNTNNTTASASVNITAPAIPQVDLFIDKDASTFNVPVGQNFTYTFDVGNAGPNPAPAGVTAVDTLPAGITFQSLVITNPAVEPRRRWAAVGRSPAPPPHRSRWRPSRTASC